MSELISGREAKLAWANGGQLQYYNSQFLSTPNWTDLTTSDPLEIFDKQYFYFRLKPQRITLNSVELNEPKTLNLIVDTVLQLEFESESERNIFINALLDRSF